MKVLIPTREVARLYDGGMSEKALATKYGCSRGTIRNRLLMEGTQIRGRSEANRLKWKQMTPEQRSAQYRAAHESTRGRKIPRSERIKYARSIQRACRLGPLELRYFDLFQRSGIEVVPLYAFEIYNIDFAIPDIKLAIEVDGGNWHNSKPKKANDRGKEVLLSSRGWSYIRFSFNRGILSIKVKSTDDRFISVLNAVASNPSLWCENSVIVGHPTIK